MYLDTLRASDLTQPQVRLGQVVQQRGEGNRGLIDVVGVLDDVLEHGVEEDLIEEESNAFLRGIGVGDIAESCYAHLENDAA